MLGSHPEKQYFSHILYRAQAILKAYIHQCSDLTDLYNTADIDVSGDMFYAKFRAILDQFYKYPSDIQNVCLQIARDVLELPYKNNMYVYLEDEHFSAFEQCVQVTDHTTLSILSSPIVNSWIEKHNGFYGCRISIHSNTDPIRAIIKTDTLTPESERLYAHVLLSPGEDAKIEEYLVLENQDVDKVTLAKLKAILLSMSKPTEDNKNE